MFRMCMRVLVAGGLLIASASPARSADAAAGQKAFTAQKCAVCHSIGGIGNKKGALDDVGAKLSEDDIRQWLLDAPAMAAKAKAERKPFMKAVPNLPKDELDSLVTYLHGLKK